MEKLLLEEEYRRRLRDSIIRDKIRKRRIEEEKRRAIEAQKLISKFNISKN